MHNELMAETLVGRNPLLLARLTWFTVEVRKEITSAASCGDAVLLEMANPQPLMAPETGRVVTAMGEVDELFPHLNQNHRDCSIIYLLFYY